MIDMIELHYLWIRFSKVLQEQANQDKKSRTEISDIQLQKPTNDIKFRHYTFCIESVVNHQ